MSDDDLLVAEGITAVQLPEDGQARRQTAHVSRAVSGQEATATPQKSGRPAARGDW